MICISHGFPGEVEFSPTSSPYPAQSRVAARAGFGDEWQKTHLSWKTMWNAFSPMLHHLCCQNKPICNNNKLTAAAILNILVPIRRDGNISHLFILLATQRSMGEKLIITYPPSYYYIPTIIYKRWYYYIPTIIYKRWYYYIPTIIYKRWYYYIPTIIYKRWYYYIPTIIYKRWYYYIPTIIYKRW